MKDKKKARKGQISENKRRVIYTPKSSKETANSGKMRTNFRRDLKAQIIVYGKV